MAMKITEFIPSDDAQLARAALEEIKGHLASGNRDAALDVLEAFGARRAASAARCAFDVGLKQPQRIKRIWRR